MARNVGIGAALVGSLAAIVLCAIAVPEALATLRVVPTPKAESPPRAVRPASARPEDGAGAAAARPEAEGNQGAGESAPRCLEELSTLSLGIEDKSLAERLRRQDCRR